MPILKLRKVPLVGAYVLESGDQNKNTGAMCSQGASKSGMCSLNLDGIRTFSAKSS